MADCTVLNFWPPPTTRVLGGQPWRGFFVGLWHALRLTADRARHVWTRHAMKRGTNRIVGKLNLLFHGPATAGEQSSNEEYRRANLTNKPRSKGRAGGDSLTFILPLPQSPRTPEPHDSSKHSICFLRKRAFRHDQQANPGKLKQTYMGIVRSSVRSRVLLLGSGRPRGAASLVLARETVCKKRNHV